MKKNNTTPGPRWIYFRFSHLTCQVPTPYAFWRPRVKPPLSRSGKQGLEDVGRSIFEDDFGKRCWFFVKHMPCHIRKNVNIIYNLYVTKRYETVALFLYCRERGNTIGGVARMFISWPCVLQAVHVTPGSLRLILPERHGHWICHFRKLHWSDGSIVFCKSHYYKRKWWWLPRIFSEIHTNLAVFRFCQIGLSDIYHFVISGSVYFFLILFFNCCDVSRFLYLGWLLGVRCELSGGGRLE